MSQKRKILSILEKSDLLPAFDGLPKMYVRLIGCRETSNFKIYTLCRGLIGRDCKELLAFYDFEHMVEQSLNSTLKQSTLEHFFTLQ